MPTKKTHKPQKPETIERWYRKALAKRDAFVDETDDEDSQLAAQRYGRSIQFFLQAANQLDHLNDMDKEKLVKTEKKLKRIADRKKLVAKDPIIAKYKKQLEERTAFKRKELKKDKDSKDEEKPDEEKPEESSSSTSSSSSSSSSSESEKSGKKPPSDKKRKADKPVASVPTPPPKKQKTAEVATTVVSGTSAIVTEKPTEFFVYLLSKESTTDDVEFISTITGLDATDKTKTSIKSALLVQYAVSHDNVPYYNTGKGKATPLEPVQKITPSNGHYGKDKTPLCFSFRSEPDKVFFYSDSKGTWQIIKLGVGGFGPVDCSFPCVPGYVFIFSLASSGRTKGLPRVTLRGVVEAVRLRYECFISTKSMQAPEWYFEDSSWIKEFSATKSPVSSSTSPTSTPSAVVKPPEKKKVSPKPKTAVEIEQDKIVKQVEKALEDTKASSAKSTAQTLLIVKQLEEELKKKKDATKAIAKPAHADDDVDI